MTTTIQDTPVQNVASRLSPRPRFGRAIAILAALCASSIAPAAGALDKGQPPKPPKPTTPTRAPFENCWVAFIHGSGVNYASNPASSADYWAMPGGNNSLPQAATTRGQTCHYRLIGYDGTEYFTAPVALIARQLTSFINDENIPDQGLIVVTHSMGGLVARFLYNASEPNSGFHQYYADRNVDLDIVRRKTSHVITIQAPHFGTEAADALSGEATRASADAFATILVAFGIQDASNARWSMRRSYFEDMLWWFDDSGRTTPLWTIGGTSTGDDSRSHDAPPSVVDDDDNLDLASNVLFGQDARYFRNDGLVEERSAHGTSILKQKYWGWFPPGFYLDYSSGRKMPGNWQPSISTPLNHNNGRYSMLMTDFYDARSGAASRMVLGDKIRLHGRKLPCSDPETGKSFGCGG